MRVVMVVVVVMLGPGPGGFAELLQGHGRGFPGGNSSRDRGHLASAFGFGQPFHPAVNAKTEQQDQIGVGDQLGRTGAGFDRMRIRSRRHEATHVEVGPAKLPGEVVEREEAGDDEGLFPRLTFLRAGRETQQGKQGKSPTGG